MTTILLVRHAAHDRVDRVLCGRMKGVHLGEVGRRQAAGLASAIAPLDALYSSPQPRAMETAAAFGETAEPVAALDEIDFGDWMGRDFASLGDDRDWQRWNANRGTARPPGGESMVEAQERVCGWMRTLPSRHPEGTVGAISHADVIKAALAGVLGLPLDAHARFDIDPASVSAVALWEGGGKVLHMNRTLAP